MAIDTAEKRKAVAAIALAYLYPSVTPNASPDAEWRQQVAHSYSGIAAEASSGTIDNDAVIQSIFSNAPVPVSADYREGRAYSDDGKMYVCDFPNDANDVNYIEGIAYRDDGAMCVTSSGSIAFERGGYGLTAVGEVVVAALEPQVYANGVPRRLSGEVCMSEIN